MNFSFLRCHDSGIMRASKALLIGAICIGLLLTTTITQAAVVYDTFYVELSANNVVNRSNSGGTGFNNGEWFEYTDPAGGPNWWNQWFFNNRDIAGSKWIEWKIFPEGDPNSVIELVINYSSRNWLDPTQPPLPDLNEFIVRESIYIGQPGSEISNIGDPLWIPDFNPIWVSIDIRFLDSVSGGSVFASGEIWHEHVVPIPSALFLLGSGLIWFVGYRRKFKK